MPELYRQLPSRLNRLCHIHPLPKTRPPSNRPSKRISLPNLLGSGENLADQSAHQISWKRLVNNWYWVLHLNKLYFFIFTSQISSAIFIIVERTLVHFTQQKLKSKRDRYNQVWPQSEEISTVVGRWHGIRLSQETTKAWGSYSKEIPWLVQRQWSSDLSDWN